MLILILWYDYNLIKVHASSITIHTHHSLLGSVFPAIGLFIIGYIGCRPTLFVMLLCLTMAFDGFRGSGYGVNLIELGPNYAGATMGVVNTAGNIMGFVAPYIVGAIVTEGVIIISMKFRFPIEYE